MDLFQSAFVGREESALEYRAFQWAEDALPGSVRSVTEIEGKPVGMASFPLLIASASSAQPEFSRTTVGAACRWP